MGYTDVHAAHLVVGVVVEGGSFIVDEFGSFHVSWRQLEHLTEAVLPTQVSQIHPTDVPLSVETQIAVQHARDRARHLHHAFVDAQHVVRGLIAEPGKSAVQVLERARIDTTITYERVLAMLTPLAA